jgi:putative tricarboxylic transport membrane protein
MINVTHDLKGIGVRMGAAGALAAALLGSTLAGAAEMRAPKGPIEITVGTSPGGTPDVLMRRAAKILNEEKIIENPIAVVNRVGGSWMIATNYVLNRPGDENLVFVITTPQFTVPLIQGLPTVHDKLTPVAVYIQNDIVLLTQPNSPWKGFKDFVDAAKQRERSVKFAGAQMGSTDSIIAGAIEKATGTKLNYIPFDGGGAAMAAFLGGNADLVAVTLDEAMPMLKSGKAKVLGLLAENRRTEAELKDIPTAKEQGFNAFYVQEFGTNGPPNMDPAIVAWWDDKLRKLVQSKGWQDMAKEAFLRTEYVGADKVRTKVDEMAEQHRQILNDLGLVKK